MAEEGMVIRRRMRAPLRMSHVLEEVGGTAWAGRDLPYRPWRTGTNHTLQSEQQSEKGREPVTC